MARQTINNGETGLSVRTKLNENFTELYGTRTANADGTFIRYADGTQICFNAFLATSSSADTVWTFPAAFADTNVAVIVTPVNGGPSPLAGHQSGPSTTSVAVNLFSGASARVEGLASVVAIGRWF